MPRVSVLMPVYNAQETLEAALESLARQTLHNFEVVAVDDGSTDHTRSILRAWEGRDERFRPLFLPHQGIIGALNAGLASCRSCYIARMDADDISLPDRLALQAAFLDARPEVSVVGCRVEGIPVGAVREGFQIYIDWQNALLEDVDIRRELFVESPLVHPSVLFRKEAVERAGGYQERGWPEDYDLWLRLYLQGDRFARLPQILFQWREREERLTRTDSRYSLENFLRAKAHYLVQGPLADREALLVWGAGMAGRRLSKHLLREGAPLQAFVDVDPKKVGGVCRGRPVLPAEALRGWWESALQPAVLVAVRARGARQLIRNRLVGFGLREGHDWWAVA